MVSAIGPASMIHAVNMDVNAMIDRYLRIRAVGRYQLRALGATAVGAPGVAGDGIHALSPKAATSLCGVTAAVLQASRPFALCPGQSGYAAPRPGVSEDVAGDGRRRPVEEAEWMGELLPRRVPGQQIADRLADRRRRSLRADGLPRQRSGYLRPAAPALRIRFVNGLGTAGEELGAV